MCLGLLGSFLPAVPSTPLVLLVAIIHKLIFPQAGVGWIIMSCLILITLVSLVFDYMASIYGAKKFGATWRGAVGAGLGGLAGLFFPFPGILIGPFLGALAFELIGGRGFKKSSRAGMGAILGLLAGAIGKLSACLIMMVLFAASVLSHSH